MIDERRNSKFQVSVNVFVLCLIEKSVVQSIIVEANLHLAVKLQSELITRAIL